MSAAVPGEFEADWNRMLGWCRDTDPERNWFTPLLEPLLLAAHQTPSLRRLYPYNVMNSLAFVERISDFLPGRPDPLPAIAIGSEGWYTVVTTPSPGGEVVAEFRDPLEALALLERLIREATGT